MTAGPWLGGICLLHADDHDPGGPRAHLLRAVVHAARGELDAARRDAGAAVRMAPDPGLEALPWDGQALLDVARGPAVEPDQASVTAALAGVAETGTLVLHSGATAPTTLNFLPETHIVVLDAAAMVGAYEEVWDRLRAAGGAAPLPRTVNLITGPSRSADIEQTLQLGAHGPRRLHIILVDHDEAPDQGR